MEKCTRDELFLGRNKGSATLPDGSRITKRAHDLFEEHTAEAEKRNTALDPEEKPYEAVDIAHEEADALNERMDELNKNYQEPTRDSEGLPAGISELLDSLSDEEFNELNHTYFYHVTNRDSIEGIMENGLGGSHLENLSDDFAYVDNLHKKYVGGRDSFFESLIMGRKSEGVGSNDARVSGERYVLDGYQVPERVQFLLENVRFLTEREYLTSEERLKCNEILQKHVANFSDKDGFIVLVGLSLVSPFLMDNQELEDSYIRLKERGYSREDIIKYLLTNPAMDIQIGKVPPQYLKVLNIFDFDEDVFKHRLAYNSHVCFPV